MKEFYFSFQKEVSLKKWDYSCAICIFFSIEIKKKIKTQTTALKFWKLSFEGYQTSLYGQENDFICKNNLNILYVCGWIA